MTPPLRGFRTSCVAVINGNPASRRRPMSAAEASGAMPRPQYSCLQRGENAAGILLSKSSQKKPFRFQNRCVLVRTAVTSPLPDAVIPNIAAAQFDYIFFRPPLQDQGGSFRGKRRIFRMTENRRGILKKYSKDPKPKKGGEKSTFLRWVSLYSVARTW